MQVENRSLRAGVMARRIALLAVVAAALGAGTFVLARNSVEQAPTAELSFNPDAAYHDDFNLSRSGRPSLAAAQAMLSDAVILELLGRVGASASDSAGNSAHAVGDFRSRLDLTEPLLETLQVRYRDPDARTAAVVANAVATALAEGAPPARAPPAHPAKGSARAAVAAWENPYRIMRLATVPPRILAEPLWLATATAAFFFAAGVFGAFLVWHRARQAADTEAGAQDGVGFTLLPPLVFAPQVPELAAARQEPLQGICAAEAEEPAQAATRRPEEVGEPAEAAAPAGGEPTTQLPFVFQMGRETGTDAPFPPRLAASEVVRSTSRMAAPAIPAAAPSARREAEMPRMAEMNWAEGRREAAQVVAGKTGGEAAPVDAPPAGKPKEIEEPQGMDGGRISLADPGAGDAVWSERILLGFAGTSIGQMLEAERRRNGTHGVARRPPSAAGTGNGREPREAERAQDGKKSAG